MKILLLSANREHSPYPVFPIGLSYLAAPLAAAGHELSVLDLCFEQEPETALAERLASFLPALVVVSLRNIDNVTWPGCRSYLAGVRDVVSVCRRSALVVVGGSGFSLMPREILVSVDADYGVVGEGEEVLPRLVESIVRGAGASDLPGVLVRGAEEFLPALPVERITTPDRSLFDVARYQRQGGMANVQTKRGCPFACIYCTYPLLEGRRMRLRPVRDIIAEIRSLIEDHGVSYIYFVDDIFNYPTEFAEQLCRAMAVERLAINWSAFINPAFMPPGLLDVMLAAGCDAVEYGTESGAPLMLRNLGKAFTVADVREGSRLCRERQVDFAHYILFGGPGETRETILESFGLMDELEPTAIIAMTGIRIFPGTPLHRTALAEGIIDNTTDLMEPVFYISPAVREELTELVTTEAIKRKNWVVPGLEVNISDAMLEALRMFPVKGPLWKLMKRLGRSRIKPL
ncbi:lipid biosynthesis B12-binding/radical SAM protein [Geobacter sp. AOG2]|uniref:lipid biosynthesis B12-binding/radical SAM protein n=1 Tax=Geobacter sp. AOG2 TaxID=1566347 RepID=UPI001CC5BFAE|nr:lipid biosynthesis B12-binding/radical SAM protein [Geobacter sp. AOG2]GFE61034.1 B12-binding domain-containing radical SAM protein [Geobacter sp. AOG2]